MTIEKHLSAADGEEVGNLVVAYAREQLQLRGYDPDVITLAAILYEECDGDHESGACPGRHFTMASNAAPSDVCAAMFQVLGDGSTTVTKMPVT